MLAGRGAYYRAARKPVLRNCFGCSSKIPGRAERALCYGVFLLDEDPDRGIEEFKQELKISASISVDSPDRVRLLRRSDWDSARSWGAEAVDLAPGILPPACARAGAARTGNATEASRSSKPAWRLAPTAPRCDSCWPAPIRKRGGRRSGARRAEFLRLDRLIRSRSREHRP